MEQKFAEQVPVVREEPKIPDSTVNELADIVEGRNEIKDGEQ